MDNKIPSGTEILDKLLEGGYEKDAVTAIYGPAGVGKTTACLICALETANHSKVLFVDTEGGFSIERARQIIPNEKELQKRLERILFLHPTTFDSQKKTIHKLPDMVGPKTGLVVVDTFTMLYRADVSSGEDVKDMNKDLAQQMAILIRIARDKKIPVILTSQVYSNFEDRNAVNIVGGDIVKYGSKCLIELQNFSGSKRKAILRKHRSLPENKEVAYEITHSGFKEAKAGGFFS